MNWIAVLRCFGGSKSTSAYDNDNAITVVYYSEDSYILINIDSVANRIHK